MTLEGPGVACKCQSPKIQPYHGNKIRGFALSLLIFNIPTTDIFGKKH